MTMPAALGLTRTRSRTPSPASDAEPARGVRASVVRALSGKREPRTVVVPRRPARDGSDPPKRAPRVVVITLESASAHRAHSGELHRARADAPAEHRHSAGAAHHQPGTPPAGASPATTSPATTPPAATSPAASPLASPPLVASPLASSPSADPSQAASLATAPPPAAPPPFAAPSSAVQLPAAPLAAVPPVEPPENGTSKDPRKRSRKKSLGRNDGRHRWLCTVQ